MGLVARLPEHLANQIAAGEVVERPASIVKELVENALDAQATRITVEVEGGGVALLRITDNGTGMTPEDALLSLERHATSKLRAFDDLRALSSFGFRGEALPSIASVSRFVLRTRLHPRRALDEGDGVDANTNTNTNTNTNEGVEIVVSGGMPSEPKPCGMASGTIIEVRDLFYNVPARRKFLKAQATESTHIGEVVENIALSHPALSLDLIRDGKRVAEWLSSRGIGDRVRTALKGEDLSELGGSRGPIGVHAFLAAPTRMRSLGASLRLFVNGRPIRDKALLRAVVQAYGGAITPGRFPVGVVFLSVPPETVDVNVHPQKTEVRFARPRDITDALFGILSLELGRAFGLPGPASRGGQGRPNSAGQTAFSGPKTSETPARTGEAWSWDRAEEPQKSTPLTNAASPLPVPSLPPLTARSPEPPVGARPGAVVSPAPVIVEADPWDLAAFDPPSERPVASPSSASDRSGPPEPSRPLRYPPLAAARAEGGSLPLPGLLPPTATPDPQGVPYAALVYLGQTRGSYLLCEGPLGVYVLDQHAASERVLYHRLTNRSFLASQAEDAPNPLLFPRIVEIPEVVATRLGEPANQAALVAVGFDLRPAGTRQVAVHGTPRLLPRADPERLLRALLDALQAPGQTTRSFADSLRQSFGAMACESALLPDEPVAPSEALALLAALAEADFATSCPHGRPLVTMLRFDELDRRTRPGSLRR
jgi:DNA mismatch repair protein MutL